MAQRPAHFPKACVGLAPDLVELVEQRLLQPPVEIVLRRPPQRP